ncbi:hypothetical protein [Streptomyces swartbergensis]|uniref:hypothetical protein n=1 Tax=Streptomyces swartbergensis TaxID=487165 RepID=UPI003815CCBE
MSKTDPHIHVEQKVVQAGSDVRNLIVSTLGRVPDAPGVVTTGCGHQVPYAMTSARPEMSPAWPVGNILTGSTCASPTRSRT